MVREHAGRQQRQRFMIGKYEIIAQPIAGSPHMPIPVPGRSEDG